MTWFWSLKNTYDSDDATPTPHGRDVSATVGIFSTMACAANLFSRSIFSFPMIANHNTVFRYLIIHL